MRRGLVATIVSLLVVSGAARAGADSVDSALAVSRGNGLPTRPELESTATASANRQARNGQLSHSDLGSLSSICSRAGEVLGAGPDVASVFTAFRASPTHWELITDPAWTAAGTAVTRGADGLVYVAVVFCVERSPSRTPQPPPATSKPAVRPLPADTHVRVEVMLGPNRFIPWADWPAAIQPTVN